jgi:integrator complex subunit 7
VVTLKCSAFLLDLLALEQDAVFGLESLLVLCSQDDSPGAQATLKVKTSLSVMPVFMA